MEIEIKTKLDQVVLNQEVVITTEADYTGAGDVLKLCKNKIRDLEEERKTYTKPLDESKKLIMAKFKETIEPINEYIEKINKSMADWYIVEEKRRLDEQKELEDKAIAEAGDNPDVVVPVVQSATKVRGNVATTSMMKTYDFVIEDEAQIPREYMIPAEGKILADIKKGITIPGIRIIEGFKPRST